jgi:hypothetical protein
MATRSLADKLRILPGTQAAVFNAPKGIATLLDPLPAGAALTSSPRGGCDVVLGFVETLSAAMAMVPRLKASLAAGGVLWVCYPKLTSPKAGEVSRDLLWKELGKLGLRAVTQVALDDTWSAIRFIPEG